MERLPACAKLVLGAADLRQQQAGRDIEWIGLKRSLERSCSCAGIGEAGVLKLCQQAQRGRALGCWQGQFDLRFEGLADLGDVIGREGVPAHLAQGGDVEWVVAVRGPMQATRLLGLAQAFV